MNGVLHDRGVFKTSSIAVEFIPGVSVLNDRRARTWRSPFAIQAADCLGRHAEECCNFSDVHQWRDRTRALGRTGAECCTDLSLVRSVLAIRPGANSALTGRVPVFDRHGLAMSAARRTWEVLACGPLKKDRPLDPNDQTVQQLR
jgi:hypothetical protein